MQENSYQTLARQLRHAKALAACSRTLLDGASDLAKRQRVLNRALAHLLHGTRMARIGLFEAQNDQARAPYSLLIAEAVAPGIRPKLDELHATPISSVTSVRTQLEAGQAVSLTVESTELFNADQLAELDVHTLLLCPIRINDIYWGYLAFGDSVAERTWSEHELMLQQTAAEMFGQVLQTWQWQTHVSAREHEASTLIDFARLATEAPDVDDVLRLITEFVRTRFSLTCCRLMIAMDSGGPEAWENVVTAGGEELDTPALDTVLQHAAAAVWAPDNVRRASTTCWSPQEHGAPTYTILALPFHTDAVVSGTLLAMWEDDDAVPPSRGDHELLEAVANQAALRINSAVLATRARQVAVLEERQRLSRDLHDSVAQSLYSLTLLADGGRRLMQNGRMDNVEAYLGDLAEIALQSLKELRLLVYELRPSLLNHTCLPDAVRHRLHSVEERAGVVGKLCIDPQVVFTAVEQEALFGIIQEALNNALKHAHARTVSICIAQEGEQRVLEIRDDGVGFAPDAVNNAAGFGLPGMQERAAGLGGVTHICATPDAGVTIRVELPV